jgi:thiol-disulfide isomerase/thioredoxin
MRLSILLALPLVACGVPAGTDPADDTVVIDPAADEDGDGISNGDEEALGTDWQSADSDGDGFEDGDEMDVGTNPLYEFSHVFDDGDYLVGNCPVQPDLDKAGPSGKVGRNKAYQEGDIAMNVGIGGTDPFGQEVSLYSFCGNYVVVTLSAEWCPPCQDLAAEMYDDTKSIRRKFDNFTFFELLYQDNYGETSDKAVVKKWHKTYGLDGIPVIAPEDQSGKDVTAFATSDGIPATTLLAPDMTVIWSTINHPDEYYLYSPETIKSLIQDYEDSLEQ